MNSSKEICWGLVWGIMAALIFTLFLFSVGRTAEFSGNGGDIEISISADSIKIEVDKDGTVKSVVIGRDRFEKTSSGIIVEDELIIEDGRIFIDGIELTEEELRRLSVDSEEESGFEWQAGKKPRRHIKRKRLATIYTDIDDDLVKFGDIIIDEGMRVGGDVVSIGGDIVVHGEVMGDVVAVLGDVAIEGKAYIGGDVVAPFGVLSLDEDAYIGGDAVSASSLGDGRHRAKFGMSARFNRVEGFTLISSVGYEDVDGKHPTLDLTGRYAFTLKRWEYDFGINHKFRDGWGPFIDVHMFQSAETSDRWILTEGENTFAGLIFKEDFHDFYWMRGLSGEGGISYKETFSVGAGYTGAKIETLEKTAEKAIFGGKKLFRENWSTVLPDSESILGIEGDLKELVLKTTFDNRDCEIDPRSGVFADLSFKKTVDSDSGGFDYQAVDAEFMAYYPFMSDQTLFFRFRGGYSDGDLPLFRRYFLGGVRSLRGYDYKEFEGNRYILFNLDYIWSFFHSNIGAGLFLDGGKAALSGSAFESAEFMTDIGLSLLLGDDIRINIAQRLDDIDKSPVFSIRSRILF